MTDRIEGARPRLFCPYPAYKDSGVEWLGNIPAHWNIAPVYARYEVALGKMLDAKRVTGESSGRYLRNVDVQWDAVNVEDLPEMDFPPSERNRYLLRSGDLLVCEGGEVGRTAVWGGELDECFYQKAIHRVRPRSDSAIPRFFYFLMYALAQRGVFTAGGNPNTIDHLTAIQLRHYRVPFPAKNEQRTIARFLDRETAKIDSLVAKKEQLIELLQEKRTALVTRAVTRGLDPNIPVKDSGVEWLGEIPAHWGFRALKRLFKVVNGSTPKSGNPANWDGDIPWVTPEDLGKLKERVLARPARYITRRGYESCGTRMVGAGSLILSTRAPIGHLAIAGTAVCTNQGCRSLVIRDSCSETYFYFQIRAARPVLEAAGRGSTFMELASADLESVALAVPPVVEQRTIADFLDRETAEIDALISNVRRAIDHLEEFRTALISAAVSGKIDVRKEAA